ncbi:hypothetical protein HYH02_012997 [Chlamydomonas schloesseri]|uniref:Glutaredoxin domain-containing protein n=1 Tax=Chlamydomonas schloesseri TaxID=2026947 RepID=A0A835T6D5_9CHLO|nr:hypothetical protein HYH02_012997 [Chlamydomonas schloesseri]|eukprot:KAG2432426.1 hypothetical protein HYH02_012997 [Chlamydomonas schloesseri]
MSSLLTTVPAAAAASGAAAAPSSAALTSDLTSARVAVMTTPACPYCRRAKEALTQAGVSYVEVDVAADEKLRQAVRDVTGKRTVPQIFVGGRGVGGCDDLLAAMADGSFQQQLDLAAQQARAQQASVPEVLLEAIAEARQRAVENRDGGAAASTSSSATAVSPHSPSAAPQRLKDLAARMAVVPVMGGVLRLPRKIGSRTLQVFSAQQLAQWLAAAGEANPHDTATQLLSFNIITPAAADRAEADRLAAKLAAAVRTAASGIHGADEVPLALTSEAPEPESGDALNVQFWWQGPARPANEVATGLRELILRLYDKHLSADGRSVSYGAMRADPLFREFVTATAELQKVDLAPLSREELMAFAINLYNALVIHALVALRLTRMSTAQRATFYSRTAKYDIGGLDYTADDLEQGVLRGNRAGASNLWNLLGLHGLAGGFWKDGNPRLAKVVRPMDPRIHFALVCGAKSCPPIRLYSAANLEEGLAAAAEAFVGGEVEVDPAKREVRLSKIFKWYAVDFGANKAERLAYVAGLLQQPARGQLEGLLAAAEAGGPQIRVTYKEYDWSLNGTD